MHFELGLRGVAWPVVLGLRGIVRIRDGLCVYSHPHICSLASGDVANATVAKSVTMRSWGATFGSSEAPSAVI